MKTCLLGLVSNQAHNPKRALERLARRALRDARGGREVRTDEAEDLMQEFLLKVFALRTQRGAAALVAEWAPMSDARFCAYVRAMMKNLALDATPAWDVQRALREVVKSALSTGLPTPAGLPATLEKNGRFSRALVAEACADLVARGVDPAAGPLTSRLMSDYALAAQACVEEAATNVQAPGRSALETLESDGTAHALVATFLAEEGPEAQRVLALRPLGFAEMGRRLDLALSTVHARYSRAAAALRAIAVRLGADETSVAAALSELAAT